HPAIASIAPHKSGITPLSPLHPGISLLSPASRDVRNEIEALQRGVMRGYTSQWLQDLDVISERSFPTPDLELEIPDWIDRPRWDGMDNDEYWAVLEECLKLVSLMLAHASSHPWFDALLHSEREDIDPRRFSARDLNRYPGDELSKHWKSISVQQPSVGSTTETPKVMEQIIRDVLQKRLRFGFMSRDINPLTDEIFENGAKVEAMAHFGENMKVYLSVQLLQPLLAGRLSEGETMAEQVFVVKTLFHELMHIFNYARNNFDGAEWRGVDVYRSMEPFFGEELECEIGLSAENAIFGGPIRPILGHNPGKAHLGFFLTSHPVPESGSVLYDVPRLINPAAPEPFFAPIPLSYYAALHQRAYWDVHVLKYGMDGLLKPPRFVSASDSNRVLSHFEFQARNINNLAKMTPDQKAVHTKAMRAELVAQYQPLALVRDEQVQEVMNGAEQLAKLPEKGTGNWNFYFEGVVEDLETLLVTHKNVVEHVPILEADAGTALTDTRQNVQGFHGHMRRYISSFLPDDGALGARLQDLVTDLDELAGKSFLEAFDPNAPVKVSKYHFVSYDVLLFEALMAFGNGDLARSEDLCKQLTQNLDVPLHLQAMARVKLADMGVGDMKERLVNVRRAMDIFGILDLECVEVHLRDPVADFAARGRELVSELEEAELEELAKGIVRS
ncbi:hypothetical protein LSUE1_G005802, partial [Lachnellula suecica]